jgi:ComF family protein
MGPIPGILLKLKYGEAFELARPLGRILAATVLAAGLAGADVVVPVPLSPRRLRSRGYNQSVLLMSMIASCLGIRPLPAALLRVRDPGPQAGRGRHERQVSVEACFLAGSRTRVAGLHVLLVDDVVTTGATASECARVLKEAGATRVDAIAVARAVPGL